MQNMPETQAEIQHFKRAIHEWVLYLNKMDKDTAERIAMLERRLAKLELDQHLR